MGMRALTLCPLPRGEGKQVRVSFPVGIGVSSIKDLRLCTPTPTLPLQGGGGLNQWFLNVLAALLAAVGLAAPSLLLAEDLAEEVKQLSRTESEIEVGAGTVSDDSFKFGDYRGLGEAGGHGIANLRVLDRGADDTGYLEITGRDLGLSSRYLKIENGEQGNYSLRLVYDELPKLHSDSYQTPFLGGGTTSLTLPAGAAFASTDTTGALRAARITPFMQDFDAETQRKALGLDLTKQLDGGWSLLANVKQEHKEGTKITGVGVGTGGSTFALLLPEPVDYTTDQFEALARYTSQRLQMQFGYYASLFKNANDRLEWQNPYDLLASGGDVNGRLGLPPDNQFHQLHASGGYVFSPLTRLSGSLSFGRMTQNEEYLPYSINTSTGATAALPRSSLDGKVVTAHADLKLTSKLAPKTNFTAAYRYDKRNNLTPRETYSYYRVDTDATVSSSSVRTNRPLDSTKQVALAELDFRLTSNTDFKLGYDYTTAKHNYEATEKEHENTYRADVRQRVSDTATAGLGYAHSYRNADEYNGAASLADGFSQGYLNSLYDDFATDGRTYAWLESPWSRKFFLTDRKRDKLRALANFAPTETIGVQLGGEYYKDEYPDTTYGLTNAKGRSANMDVSLAASEVVTGHFFASLEKYETDQNGADRGAILALNFAPMLENNSVPDSNRWTVSAHDDTFTSGLGLRVKSSAKFEYGGDFSYAYSEGRFAFTAGSNLSVAPLPDLITRLKRLDLFARYNVQKDLSLNLRYVHERYRSDDWGYDELQLSTIAGSNMIGTNQTSPDYKVNFVGLSVAYRYR